MVLTGTRDVFTHVDADWRSVYGEPCPPAIELERTRSGKTGVYYVCATGENMLSVALMLGQTQGQVMK